MRGCVVDMKTTTVSYLLEAAITDADADGLVGDHCLCLAGDLMSSSCASSIGCELGVLETVELTPPCGVMDMDEAEARLNAALANEPDPPRFSMYDYDGRYAYLMRALDADEVFTKIKKGDI